MANFKQVNKTIKATFPNLKVEAVRGDGYVWFDMSATPIETEPVESIMVHPFSCNTKELTQLVTEHLEEYQNGILCNSKKDI